MLVPNLNRLLTAKIIAAQIVHGQIKQLQQLVHVQLALIHTFHFVQQLILQQQIVQNKEVVLMWIQSVHNLQDALHMLKLQQQNAKPYPICVFQMEHNAQMYLNVKTIQKINVNQLQVYIAPTNVN